MSGQRQSHAPVLPVRPHDARARARTSSCITRFLGSTKAPALAAAWRCLVGCQRHVPVLPVRPHDARARARISSSITRFAGKATVQNCDKPHHCPNISHRPFCTQSPHPPRPKPQGAEGSHRHQHFRGVPIARSAMRPVARVRRRQDDRHTSADTSHRRRLNKGRPAGEGIKGPPF
jgi:hypothetical protein